MLTIKHTTEVSLSAEDFFDFLKQNNAFEVYKSNLLNYYRKQNLDLDLVTTLDNVFDDSNSVKSWISCGFTWNSTPEGWEYWNNLDIEWRKYFRKCDKINLIPISAKDLKKYFREPVTGKWYKVTDNSYNRSADNDPNCVWITTSVSVGWKNLVGKEYLILEEPCCVIIDYSFKIIDRKMVKVWVPEYNCAQWVLFDPKNVCENTK